MSKKKSPKKTICPKCGKEMVLDPMHGKLMVHQEGGNYFCEYGVIDRNGDGK